MFPSKPAEKIEKTNLNRIDQIKEQIFNSKQEEKVSAALDELFDFYPIITLEFTAINNLHRARDISDTGQLSYIKDMLWRKSSDLTLNRANTRDIQVIYFANHLHSAIEEIRPSNSKRLSVQTVSCNLLPDKRALLCPVGELYHVVRTGQSRLGDEAAGIQLTNLLQTLSEKNSLKLLVADAIIFNAFNSSDRMVSNLVAKKLFRGCGENVSIVFASQKHYGALNYVMSSKCFLPNFGVIGGLHCPNVNEHGFGLLDVSANKFVKGISKFGKLTWRSQGEYKTEKETFFEPVKIKKYLTNN